MKIIKATEITNPQGTYLIYGNPGVGKTSTLKYLDGKTLVIDIDKTSHVLKGSQNIDIYKLDTANAWQDWENTVMEVVKMNYDNIVIDNITELERAFLGQLGGEGKNNGVPSMANYQQVQFRLIRSLRYLKNANAKIILTAWETTEDFTDADTGQTFTMAIPDIQRKIRNNVMGLCDVVARLVVSKDTDGNITRGFYLQPTRTIFAKNQLDERTGCRQDELFIKRLSKADDTRGQSGVPERK